MEPVHLNPTKQGLGAFKQTRTDLHKEQEKIKNNVQTGRNIKNVSQNFVNNLTNFGDSSKRMVEKLKELEKGNVKGDAGEEGLKVNYFEIVTERMKNELGCIIKSCAKVLKLPSKGRYGS